MIVATGASAKWLGIPSEKAYQGHGVSACATCDGFFFKGVEVAVVGGGDTAIEEATFLTKFASKVHLVHRRDELRASKIMQERARKNPKIEFVWHSGGRRGARRRQGGDRRCGSRARRTGAPASCPVQGVFMAIGHEPNTGVFKGQLDMNEVGYLNVKAPSTHTSRDRGLRRRRRGRPELPPGGDGGRIGLHGGHRRRALPGRAGHPLIRGAPCG